MPAPDVALVSPYPPPGQRHGGSSGVASYTANLAHALTDAGAQVTVVAPVEDGLPTGHRDGAVTVHRSFRRGRPAAVPAALAAARATGAGVVHLQHELFLYGGPPTVPALLPALRSPGAPAVVTMHQVVDPADVTAGYRRMHRIRVPAPLARLAVAGLQRGLAAAAAAVLVHEPAFTRVLPGARAVPHGVETHPPAGPDDRRRARRALGWPDDGFTALCFGFLAPYKGLELACAGAEHARHARLVVAGGEHPRLVAAGDPYAATLAARHRDRVRFTGYVPDADVAATFAAADLVLLPYPRPHAASGVLALALGHSRPALLSGALAATTGAGPELVLADRPAGAGAQLDRLATDPSALDRVAAGTRRLATGRDWPAVARRHLDIYREVRDARRAARRCVRPAQRR